MFLCDRSWRWNIWQCLKFKPTKTHTIIIDQSSSTTVSLLEKVVGSRRVGPSDSFWKTWPWSGRVCQWATHGKFYCLYETSHWAIRKSMNKISSLAILPHKFRALETKQRQDYDETRGDDANLLRSDPRQVIGVSLSCRSVTDNKKTSNSNS